MNGMMWTCRACKFVRKTGWPARDEQKQCPNAHGKMKYAFIDGVEAPEVKCDSRCTHAKGASCSCSCGGANHGAAYA